MTTKSVLLEIVTPADVRDLLQQFETPAGATIEMAEQAGEENLFLLHLADLASYFQAQERLGEPYANPGKWAHKAIVNGASSGKFASDRTIAEYTANIWKGNPCPVL